MSALNKNVIELGNGTSPSKHTGKIKLVFVLSVVLMVSSSLAKEYEVPPSETTSSSVPWISDEAMERCVKLYNEAQWLAEEIELSVVNQYSHASVDNYNSKVNRQSEMIDYFNENCAGKQSESAFKAAEKLNQIQNQ